MPSNTENMSCEADLEGSDELEVKKHIIEVRQRKVLANLGSMVKEIEGGGIRKDHLEEDENSEFY